MTPAAKALAAAALVALAAGCTSTGLGRGGPSSSAASSDVETQLFKLQKDSARILTELERLREASEGSEGLQATCAEAVTRMAEVERRVLALEEHALATQRRLDETLAALRAMRGGGTWSPAFGGTGDAATAAPGWPTADTATPPAEEGGGQGAPAAPPASGMAPEDLFNAAYADYSRGKYELALAGFEAARRADPAGPLAADARHWTGETLFAMGRHLEAAEAFDKVITEHGAGRRTTSAHLKKGLALLEGRRTAEGVMELQYVIDTWPESDEARIAAEYFKRKGIVQD